MPCIVHGLVPLSTEYIAIQALSDTYILSPMRHHYGGTAVSYHRVDLGTGYKVTDLPHDYMPDEAQGEMDRQNLVCGCTSHAQ